MADRDRAGLVGVQALDGSESDLEVEAGNDADRCRVGVVFPPGREDDDLWDEYLRRFPRREPATKDEGGTPRLNPRFVEALMGFPEGWVDVGLGRNEQLRALGNAVLPQVGMVAGEIINELERRNAMSSKGQRDRIENDFYETPLWVVQVMARMAVKVFGKANIKHFHDPFAGRGAIIGPLANFFEGKTFSVTELDPVREEIAVQEAGCKAPKQYGRDAYTTKIDLPPGTVLTLNPPFEDPMRALDHAAVEDPKHDCWNHENVLGSIVIGPSSWRHSGDRREWWLTVGKKGLYAEVPLPHRPCFAWPCNGTIVLPSGGKEKCPKIYPVGSRFDCPHCGNGKPKAGSDSVDYSLFIWARGYEGPAMLDFSIKPIDLEARKRIWFERNEGLVLPPPREVPAQVYTPDPYIEGMRKREEEKAKTEEAVQAFVEAVSDTKPSSQPDSAIVASPANPAEVSDSEEAQVTDPKPAEEPPKKRGPGRPRKVQPEAVEPKTADVLEGSKQRVTDHAKKLMAEYLDDLAKKTKAEDIATQLDVDDSPLLDGLLKRWEEPAKLLKTKLSLEEQIDIANMVMADWLKKHLPKKAEKIEDRDRFFPVDLVGRKAKGRGLVLLGSAASILLKAHWEKGDMGNAEDEDPVEAAKERLLRLNARQAKDGMTEAEILKLSDAIAEIPDERLEVLVNSTRAPAGSNFCVECGLVQSQEGDCYNHCGAESMDLTGEVL